MIKMTIDRSEHFKFIFHQKGYTIKSLSDKIGIETSVFNRKIHGKYRFYVEEAIKICNILDMPFEEIFKN